MKKFLAVLLIVMMFSTIAYGAKVEGVRLQDKVLTYSSGYYLDEEIIPLGYDAYGYNYQAHMFNGYYVNVYLNKAGFPPYEGDTEAYLEVYPDAESYWAWPYRDTIITMKWNDAWLANSDQDEDESLDRHLGFDTYKGSGAWEAYHETWYDEDGFRHNYFCKIVAVPADAYRIGVANDGIWYTVDDEEIGPDIWGQFAIIQETDRGSIYKSPIRAGLGDWY